MTKRTKAIEDAINYLDLYEVYSIYQEAWGIVYDYIEQLEQNIQERMTDEGKED